MRTSQRIATGAERRGGVAAATTTRPLGEQRTLPLDGAPIDLGGAPSRTLAASTPSVSAVATRPVATQQQQQQQQHTTTSLLTTSTAFSTSSSSSAASSLPAATPDVRVFAMPRSERRLVDLQRHLGVANVALECKGSTEASQFMGRVTVLGVIGSGLAGVVLRCAAENRVFALKLEPVFRHAVLNPTSKRLEETEHNSMARREMLTVALLNSIATYETQTLGRAYSEMTFHTVRTLQWGTLRMSPYDRLRGLANVVMSSETRSFLSQSRTWSYMVMELASGGSAAALIGYTNRLYDTTLAADAAERFLAAMYTQIAAQLLIVGVQRNVCHNDMHLDNVCWVHEAPSRHIYYHLPGDVHLLLPLADTVPLGPLAGTPAEHGALVFKIIDWGLGSAETPYFDGTRTIMLRYGPTHAAGGEYDDGQFYARFDFAQLLATLHTQLKRDLPPHVAQVLSFARTRQRDNTLACIASAYPDSDISCDGTRVAPSATPPHVDAAFCARLFSLPLFARYRLPSAAALDRLPATDVITVRCATPAHSAGVTQRAIQNETLHVETQPIDHLSGTYRAKLSARTL